MSATGTCNIQCSDGLHEPLYASLGCLHLHSTAHSMLSVLSAAYNILRLLSSEQRMLNNVTMHTSLLCLLCSGSNPSGELS